MLPPLKEVYGSARCAIFSCSLQCHPIIYACSGCRAVQIAKWVAIVILVVVVLHFILALLVRWRGWHLPSFLEFPRPELFLALFLASPIAQAAGREYTVYLHFIP